MREHQPRPAGTQAEPGPAARDPALSSDTGPRTTTLASHDLSAIGVSAPSTSEADEERAADRAAQGFGPGARAPAVSVAPPPSARTPPPWAGAGRPLPDAHRPGLERWFGADLSTVRIHDGPAARDAVREAGAGAITAGEDIAVRHGSAASRPSLLAHEVAHVVQQRTGPPRLRFAPPEAAGPEVAVPDQAGAVSSAAELAITINGIRLSRPGLPLTSGVSVRDQVLEAFVARVVPDAGAGFAAQLWSELEAKGVPRVGFFATDRLAADEPFPDTWISPLGWASIADALQALGREPTGLDPKHLRVLEVSVSAAVDTAGAVFLMRERYPWYTEKLWLQQVAQHAAGYSALVDDAKQRRAQSTTDGMTAGEQAFVATLRVPLDAVEVIRTSTDLAGDEKVGAVYQAVWGPTTAGGPANDYASSEDLLAELVLFADEQPGLRDGVAERPGDRIELLLRFARKVQRVVSADPAGELLQKLVDTERPFTDPAYPATLQVFPIPPGPEPVIPAQVDSIFRFMVQFPSVLDAFQHYAYAWDLIEWKPAEATAAKEAAQAQESLGSPAEREAMDLDQKPAVQATTGDVIKQRFARDVADATADIKTIYDTLGPAGVTATPDYAVVLGMRELGTVARIGIDYVTLDNGPGLRERPIAFPHPGVWIVRVAAVPVYGDKAEVTRPPSMAYLALYATAQTEMAQASLTTFETEQAERTAEREQDLAELAKKIDAATDPAERTILEDAQVTLWMSADTWVSREMAQNKLTATLAEIDQTIKATEDETPGTERDQKLALLKTQRSSVAQQLTQVSETIEMHDERREGDAALGKATALPVAFSTDDGQMHQLDLEYAVRPAGQGFSVSLADYTTTHSGMAEGEGPTLAAAVANALRELLQGEYGYGRGVAAVKLPGATSATTLRIEKSLGSLATEAWQDITTVVTIGALVAAPFTGGSSLAILVPIGVAGGGFAVYRMYSRHEVATLRWDLATASDLLDIVGALLVGAAVGRSLLSGKTFTSAARVAGFIVIGVDLGSNVGGLVVLGVQLERELADIAADRSLSDSQKRARSLIALGTAMMQIGMMAGQSLVHQGLGISAEKGGKARPEAGEGRRTLPEKTPTTEELRVPTPTEEGPAPTEGTPTPTEEAPAKESPSEQAPSTEPPAIEPPATKPPATEPPATEPSVVHGPKTALEELATGRPDIAEQFARADRKARPPGTPSVSEAFEEIIRFLSENGLTREGFDAIAHRLAPARGQKVLSATRLQEVMTTLTTLAERVRNDPGSLAPNYPADKMKSLVQQARMITEEAAAGRTADGRKIPDPRAPGLRDAVDALNAAIADQQSRQAADPITRLLDLMALESLVGKTSETVRSYGRRFEVDPPELTLAGEKAADGAGRPTFEAIRGRLKEISDALGVKGRRLTKSAPRLLDLLRLGTVKTVAEGQPGEPLARNLAGMGLEKYALSPTGIGKLKTVPKGLATRLADMFAGFQRAHLVGPGFGDELYEGLALAPGDFNQNPQNRGIELLLRKAVAEGFEPEVKIVVESDRLAIPVEGGGFEYVDVARRVEYTIVRDEGPPMVVEFEISGPPKPGWKTVRNDLPPGTPGSDVL